MALFIGSANPNLYSSELVSNKKKKSVAGNSGGGYSSSSTASPIIYNDITRFGTPANQLAASNVSKVASPAKKVDLSSTLNNTYDVSNYVNSLVGAGASGGSGGYYTLDIGDMLKAYEQQADADRAVAKQSYDTARNDLLTSLKRFQDQYNTSKEDLATTLNRYKQEYDTSLDTLATALNRYKEQNALDVQNQQKDYVSGQAAIEAAIQQADRQNRISAAARGLGGSGLQQLAQLQTLLSQGQNISNLANENQSVMDALRKALANKEEDTNKSREALRREYTNREEDTNRALEALRKEYTNREEDINTNLSNLLNTYTNNLNSINARLATNKANAEVQRANSYIPYSPGSSSISAAEAQSYGNDLAGQLSTIVRAYQTAKNGTDNTTTYRPSLDALDSLGLPQNGALYQQAKNNLISIYKSKHNGKSPSY